MRSQLNSGGFAQRKLQQDWTANGGEQGFDIQPYVWGVDYETEVSRKELVNQLIWQAQSHGQKTYNTPLASQPPTTQIPLPMDWSGPVPYFPPSNKFPNANPINLGEQVAVVVNGKTYLSLVEAARCLDTTDRTVRAWAESPASPSCTFAYREEVQAELERRNWSVDRLFHKSLKNLVKVQLEQLVLMVRNTLTKKKLLLVKMSLQKQFVNGWKRDLIIVIFWTHLQTPRIALLNLSFKHSKQCVFDLF